MQQSAKELKVTVFLRIHDRSNFYKEALNSILDQDCQRDAIRLVVLTNLEDVAEYFRNFADIDNSVYYYQTGSEGEVLYRGIESSSGPILCFLDDDDLWAKERVSVILEAFKNNPKLGYFHNSVEPFSDDSVKVQRKIYERKSNNDLLYVDNVDKHRMIRKITEYYPDFNLSSICILRDVIVKHLDDLPRVSTSPDTFFYFCALDSAFDLLLDSRALTLYRHHSKILSTSNARNSKWNVDVFESHQTLLNVFSGGGPLLKNIAVRRYVLTKIQISLISLDIPRKTRIKYFIEYLRIFLYFLIPVDFLVLSLCALSIFDKGLGKRIYHNFM